jgi:hypothetical protein
VATIQHIYYGAGAHADSKSILIGSTQMPRTAVFMESMAPFGDNMCPIKHETAERIEGCVATVDGEPKHTPWDLDSLLTWLDIKRSNPTNREPLYVKDIHPVLTPTLSRAAYRHAIVELAKRRWDGQAEVARDVAACSAYWETQANLKKKRPRDFDDCVYDKVLLPDFLAAMRAARPMSMWERFQVECRTQGTQKARQWLDRTLCAERFGTLKRCDAVYTTDYVDFFLARRVEAWSHHNNIMGQPIWMEFDSLYTDFLKVYASLVTPTPLKEGRPRVMAMMIHWTQSSINLHIANLTDTDSAAIVVGMEPHIPAYLLGHALRTDRDFFSEPRSGELIGKHLMIMEKNRTGGLFTLEMSMDDMIVKVMSSFKSRGDGMYVLDPERIHHIESQPALIPHSPYNQTTMQSTLKGGLDAIDERRMMNADDEDDDDDEE